MWWRIGSTRVNKQREEGGRGGKEAVEKDGPMEMDEGRAGRYVDKRYIQTERIKSQPGVVPGSTLSAAFKVNLGMSIFQTSRKVYNTSYRVV